jgi:steroid delta-isomerase-like uncharacterized protein
MPSSNIDTARTYLEAAYRGDLDTTRQLIADGYVFVDYAKENIADTPEALRQAFQDDLGAWSDRQLEIENMMETTDGRVITQMRITATHTGTYKSVPATGRRVANTACNILRFDAQGRVVVEEAYHDDLTIMVHSEPSNDPVATEVRTTRATRHRRSLRNAYLPICARHVEGPCLRRCQATSSRLRVRAHSGTGNMSASARVAPGFGARQEMMSGV